MAEDRPSISQAARWSLAVPASLLCHVLIAVLLLRAGADPSANAEATERMEPLEIPINLGIQQSEAVTPNWLGFEIPTPHVAAPSLTEQSALTRAQGDQRDNLARAVAATLQARTTQAVAQARSMLDAFQERLAEAGAQAELRAQNQERDQPTPPEPIEEPAPKPAPAEPTPAEDDSKDGSPGIQDTRSAPPSSEPVELRRRELGRVIASEGLRINTSRIHLTSLQRAFRARQDPLVEIFFDHQGRVSEARVPPGRGTGRSDIDQALINAIYEWTAEGEPIEALREGDAPLLIRMRILM